MLITWNVRGLGLDTKRFGVRDFCQLNKFDIICLQETKLNTVTESILKSLGGNLFDWSFVPSEGSSGGIMIGWNSSSWKMLQEKVDKYVLTVVLQSKKNNFKWTLSSVYGPHCNKERMVFWQELKDIKNTFSGPWIVVGDFNVTSNSSERKGKSNYRREMEEFNDIINELELIDSPLHGRKFT
ncbi:uncharacterized protein LOC109838607 [Asparagus officinalis]|uniref:uncharacterized protein LOC109838607 n=1 Tax=Asparagus officinalis TaxID=4686 RepID=UPI00098E1A49|nr:uncharacterized protein LOC109838607 [Asparagus officinalis]